MAGSAAEPVFRKLAHRFIPFLFLLYIVNFLDRVNVGFAATQMNHDLGLGPEQYGFGAGIFFAGYVLLEVPSNLALARFGARFWLARIIVSWGLVSMAMAFVHDATSFYVLRFLLGVAEAGFFPGIVFFLSQWFPTHWRGRSVAWFMTAAAVSVVIGAPLSAALLGMDGILGLRGWQWLFVIEGAPAVLLGFAIPFVLADQPAKAKWLSPEEREAVARELPRGSASGHAGLGKALTRPITLLFALLYFSLVVGLYGIALWLPLILKSRGDLATLEIGFLSAIPYLAAAVTMVALARLSDRSGRRWPFIAGGLAALIGGLVGAALVSGPYAGITALSVAAAGNLSAISLFWSLPARRFEGVAAAGAIALINSIGNVGGFVGPYLVGWFRSLGGDFNLPLLGLAAFPTLGLGLALILWRNEVLDVRAASSR